MKAFQSNAFQIRYPGQSAFQGFDRFVFTSFYSCLPLFEIILFVNGSREMQVYAQGAVLVFQARVFDPTEIPALPFSPTAVELTVLNPDGTLLLEDEPMIAISEGVFEYIYQTTVDDQPGVYQVNMLATSGDNTHQTLNQIAFKLLVNA